MKKKENSSEALQDLERRFNAYWTHHASLPTNGSLILATSRNSLTGELAGLSTAAHVGSVFNLHAQLHSDGREFRAAEVRSLVKRYKNTLRASEEISQRAGLFSSYDEQSLLSGVGGGSSFKDLWDRAHLLEALCGLPKGMRVRPVRGALAGIEDENRKDVRSAARAINGLFKKYGLSEVRISGTPSPGTTQARLFSLLEESMGRRIERVRRGSVVNSKSQVPSRGRTPSPVLAQP